MSKPKTTLKEPTIDNRLLDERGPTPEWHQRRREAPIVLAHSKSQITHAQFAAGQRFYEHWFKGGLCEHYGTPDMDRIYGTGEATGMPKSELQAHHRRLFRGALEELQQRAWVLERIICQEMPIPEVGHLLGWNTRNQAFAAAMESLRIGLDVLCARWGIEST